MATVGEIVVLSEFMDAEINTRGSVVIIRKNKIIGQLQGSDTEQQLGKYLWAGYDSDRSSSKRQIILGVSSQASLNNS